MPDLDKIAKLPDTPKFTVASEPDASTGGTT